jgi:hypothetical protein
MSDNIAKLAVYDNEYMRLVQPLVFVFRKMSKAVAEARNYDAECSLAMRTEMPKFRASLDGVWNGMLAIDGEIDGFLCKNIRRLESMAKDEERVRRVGRRVHEDFVEDFQSLLARIQRCGHPDEIDPIEQRAYQMLNKIEKVPQVGSKIAALGAAGTFGAVLGAGFTETCGGVGCIEICGRVLVSGSGWVIVAAIGLAALAWGTCRGIGWGIDKLRQKTMDQKMKNVTDALNELVVTCENLRQKRIDGILNANEGKKIAVRVSDAIPDFLDGLDEWNTTQQLLNTAVAQLRQVRAALSVRYEISSSGWSIKKVALVGAVTAVTTAIVLHECTTGGSTVKRLLDSGQQKTQAMIENE